MYRGCQTSHSISSWRYFSAFIASGLVCNCSLVALDTKLAKPVPAGPSVNPPASVGLVPVAPGQVDLDATAGAIAEKLKQLGMRNGVANAAPPVPSQAHKNIAQQTAIKRLRERTGEDVVIHLREGNKTVMQIRGAVLEPSAPGAALEAEGERERRTARNFLRVNRDLLRVDDPDNELALANQEKDDIGHHHLKFNQTFKGIPVWPSGLSVHLDPKGNVRLLDGAYVPTPSAIDGKPVLSSAQATDRAKASVDEGEKGTMSVPALIIYSPLEKEPRLAWKLSLKLDFRHSWIFIVDALDARILNQISQVMDVNVVGSARDLKGTTRTINVWSQDGKFTMFNTSKQMFKAGSDPFSGTTQGVIRIVDGQDKTPENFAIQNAALVTSTDVNSWLPDAVSAAFNFSLTYDYYLEHHNRNSLDGKGGSILAFVRIADEKHNAAWASDGFMVFGDDIPLAAGLDVIGHELTHGITQNTAGLVAGNQPGALNEAFSDIMGEMVEASRDGEPDWQMGEEIPFIIRNLKNPGAINDQGIGPFPSKMSEFANLPPDVDRGGEHHNSTIISHAYYLLAEGLNGALGLRDSEKIFYRTLTVHLQKQSQFVDCRLACVASAEELFGTNSTQVLKVKEAFDAVELFDTPATPPPSPNPTVQGADSTLFVAIDPFTFNLALGRREAAQGDGTGGVALAEPIQSARPSVSGDGSFVFFVNAFNDACVVNTDNPNSVQCLGFQGLVHSVAIAPNATLAAFVLRDPNTGVATNKINVFDLVKNSFKTYNLLAPTADGASVDAVLHADSMVFTADSKQLIYDAVSELRFNGGQPVQRWTIYKIDLATDTAVALFPPQEGADIGNPNIGRVSNRYLTFEVVSQKTAASTILNLDLFTGDLGAVGFVGPGLGFPCFTGDESAVVYSVRDSTAVDNGYSLVRQPLTTDRLGTNGPPSLWLQEASIGVVYRRGTFTSSNALPQVRIVSPTDGQTFTPPIDFAFTVEASDPDGTIAKVEFYLGSDKIAEGTSPPYSVRFQGDNPTPGKLRLGARAIDNLGGVADATTVEVTIGGPPTGNQPPQIDPIPDQTIALGDQLTVNVTGTDPDVGQTLTYNLDPGTPAGAAIDPATGVFTWTANLQGLGTISITVRATDSGSPPMSATQTFSVKVVAPTGANRPPVIDPIPDQTVAQGNPLSISVGAIDPDAGQILIYSLDPGAPTGATINSTTGLFTWIPTSLQAPGVVLITVRVSDNATPPLSATARLRVNVQQGAANRAPTITVIPDQTIAQGARLSVQVNATDPDAGQTLAYSLEPGAPVGAAIDPATGLFTWTPTSLQVPGVLLITVRVTDSGQPSQSITQRFKVTVIAGNVIELTARVIPGALQLSIKGGDLNGIFTVQQSDDLLTWTPAPGGTVVKSTTNDVLFNDPSSPSSKKRFYRVLVEAN